MNTESLALVALVEWYNATTSTSLCFATIVRLNPTALAWPAKLVVNTYASSGENLFSELSQVS